jgi:outer membrane protein assembly factor BamD (BamD/ComL family)
MPQPLRIALMLFAAIGVLGFLLWFFWRALRESESPVRLIVKWIVTFLLVGWVVYEARRAQGAGRLAVLLFVALPVAVVMIILWGRSIGGLVARPFETMFTGGSEEPDPQPLYSIAEGLRRRGKFREAIYEIQGQLNRFPKDFTGQMMLAEIQAENLNELASAEITIHRICEQPNHAPASVASALNSLADWQLKYAQDVDAATGSMKKIIELLPDSEFARAAANRIAHFSNREQLLHARAPGKIQMKHGVEYLGLLKDQSHLMPKEKTFKDEAAELVAHLDSHPLDNEARERLAIIYARDYGRLDLATEQLEQLIALPGESPKHVTRWLHLLADLQIHCTNDTQLAEQTLQRIVELFPNQSQSELAKQRIVVLALELKHYEKGRTVKFDSSSTGT